MESRQKGRSKIQSGHTGPTVVKILAEKTTAKQLQSDQGSKRTFWDRIGIINGEEDQVIAPKKTKKMKGPHRGGTQPMGEKREDEKGANSQLLPGRQWVKSINVPEKGTRRRKRRTTAITPSALKKRKRKLPGLQQFTKRKKGKKKKKER